MSKTVDDYISELASPQKEICRYLRKLIFDTFPGIKEAMKWGVPAYADGKYYLVALKDHVNLGFAIKGLPKEDIALFDGGGKTTKHIQINNPDNIDLQRIIGLLKLVDTKVVV